MNRILISVAAVAVSCSAMSAHAALDRTIRVSGNCHRDVVPDRGAIIVTVDILDRELMESNKRATRIYEKVKSDVERLRLKDSRIETSTYQVQEQKDWEKDRSVFKGFRTLLGLRVETTETARLGEVIQIASREQVKNVGSLSFFASRDLMEKTRLECLKDAAEHARTKAAKLAESLGVKLGRVLQLEEGGGGYSPVQPMAENFGMAKMSMAADSAPAPSLAPGAQLLDLSVTVVFALD